MKSASQISNNTDSKARLTLSRQINLTQWCFVLLLSFMMVGCSDDGLQDLHAFVENVKAQPGGRVAPLPEIKTFEIFVYEEDGRKDPFATWRSDVPSVAQVSSVNMGVMPDINRRKEVLETFPIDALLMMGIVEFSDIKWGLVKAPDGIVYRVKSGNYLGQNFGKINEVLADRIVITEVIQDGLGGWEERQSSINLSE